MTGRWPSPGAIAAGVAAGAGTWLSLATVGLSGDAENATLAVLPADWLLPVLVLASVALVGLLRLTTAEAAPLYLPLLSALPWLPGPNVAASLALGGPLSRLIPIATGVALAITLWPRLPPRLRYRPARDHLITAFVLASAAYLLAAWRVAPVIPGGDEPHYLVIAQSLLHDGDLRIEDNHRRREYAAYVEGDLRPDYLKRGVDGQIYSVHAPGLPALVAPAFALAGYRGVVFFLALFSAAGTLAVWVAAWRLSGSFAGAWAAWATAALTAPFLFQSFTVYPDGPAAVLVALVLCVAWTSRSLSHATLAVSGAALALLPWLHARYALLAAALGVVVIGRLWHDMRAAQAAPGTALGRALALLAIPALGAAAWFAMFVSIYGTWNPGAPYGGATQLSLARIPIGLSGLLLDQQFGLLANAPVFVLVLLAIAVLARQRPWIVTTLALVVIPYVLVVAGFHMWWGGRSTPARFLVPVLLALAVPIGPWFAAAGRTRRAIFGTLLVASVLLCAVLVVVERGALAYNSRDGFALWLDWAAPSVRLATALPSLFQGALAAAWERAATWAAAAALGAGLLAAVTARWQLSRGPLALAAGLVFALALHLGATLAWQGRPEALDPGASRLALLRAACGDPAGIVVPLDIPDASRRPASPQRAAWSGRDLPPGRYEIVLDTGLRVGGEVSVALDRGNTAIETCRIQDRLAGPTRCAVTLPAGARTLQVTADPALGRLSTLRLRWTPIERDSGCDQLARRGTRSGELVLFSLDEHAAVEPGGAWVLGGRTARLVLQPLTRPGRTVPLLLRNGPAPNEITVTSGGWTETVVLAAGDARTLDVPRAAPTAAVRVSVSSAAGFVPAEVEQGSRDYRRLGVWVAGAATQNLTVPPK